MNFEKFPRTPLNDCFSTIHHFLAENPSKVLNGQQQHKEVTFHWSRISPSLVILFLKSFTMIIFYYVGQTPLEACSGDQVHRENVSFLMQLNFEFFVCLFLRKCPFQFPCSLLCYLLMQKNAQTAVHRCSPKQVFLKIVQYSQEKTCVEASF